MYLLDTNICIALIQANPKVISEFNCKREDCYLSAIVLAELYKGVYCSQRVEHNTEVLQQFIQPFAILPFDSLAAIEFGKIQAELRRIGRPTGSLDAAFPAVVRSREDILVSNNIRHFENISNLQLENWLDS
ncbi:type II toxin-antitoxin system VapC family toxin [Oculatella sp. FACHB-28]|uniref:PIN domain-containing protein n=1 Tax=Oculatella sp. FACHB-28 TaxID=2692845 RepID=UPI001681D735|nr:type II toxin-antitoxin system VapC family toxin [Oculatella sp. FACHB-28]